MRVFAQECLFEENVRRDYVAVFMSRGETNQSPEPHRNCLANTEIERKLHTFLDAAPLRCKKNQDGEARQFSNVISERNIFLA